MLGYIRTWWLLNRLGKDCMRHAAQGRAAFPASDIANIVGKLQSLNGATTFERDDFHYPHISLEIFLSERASRYPLRFPLFLKRLGILKKKVDQHIAHRIELDRVWLRRTTRTIPALTEIILGKDYAMAPLHRQQEDFIRITDEGFFFSKPTNGLVGFASTYKVIWAIVIGAISWSPSGRAIIKYLAGYLGRLLVMLAA